CINQLIIIIVVNTYSFLQINKRNFLNLFYFINQLTRRSTLFPTRRSSDLSPSNTPAVRLAARSRSAASGRCAPAASCSSSSKARSEEHTSELQSPCNLVCRLLLEKKKDRKPSFTEIPCTGIY